MSHVAQSFTARIRFPVRLKCAKCGADGHATWEENADMSEKGPLSSLENLSDGFARFQEGGPGGPIRIVCNGCGAVVD